MEEDKHIFTEDDITNCWIYHLSYFADILNGNYSVEEAREDLLSLINSKFDNKGDLKWKKI